MKNSDLSDASREGPAEAASSVAGSDNAFGQWAKPTAVSLLSEPQPGDVLDGRFKILQAINRGQILLNRFRNKRRFDRLAGLRIRSWEFFRVVKKVAIF